MIQSVPRSRVIHLGADTSRCGYCRRSDGSHNYAMWALRLHVDDYQELLDAGWRRSGSYLYRPNLSRTCCPPYVIRLDATHFKPSTTHKRVLKRLRHASAAPVAAGAQPPAPPRPHPHNHQTPSAPPAPDRLVHTLRAAVVHAVHALAADAHFAPALRPHHVQQALSEFKLFPPRRHATKLPSPTPDPPPRAAHAAGPPDSAAPPILVCNVALVLAAVERRRSRAGAAPAHGAPHAARRSAHDPQHTQMRIANALQPILSHHQSPVSFSTAVSHPGFLNFWSAAPDEAAVQHHAASSKCKAQRRSKHAQPLPRATACSWPPKRPSRLSNICVSDVSELDVMSDADQTQASQRPRAPAQQSAPRSAQPAPQQRAAVSNVSNFTMQMVPSVFSEESYDLFRRYQMSVHHERASQCTKEIYVRFLVESPLTRYPLASNSEERYGSFHVLYRIAGTLFAVGVVDVLPRCLSSVYLFYDPDFGKLSPGTLSALKEIEWIKSVSHTYPSLRYYYMGYYIHSCPKMRYKASFSPSELLCEESKNWVPVSEARRILDSVEGRALRLAPPDKAPAPAAAHFQFDDEELERLADEAILHAGNPEDEVMQVLSFKSLRESLGFRCPDQVNMIRRGIEAFLRHVGKRNSQYYVHML